MSAQETLPIITLDITPDTAPAIFRGAGLGQYFEHIRASVNEAPDLSTKRGRDRIASLAAQVSRSKTAVERPGREYLKSIKALPKLIETELREFADMCDDLRDEVRRPLTEWEAEQARIEDERKAAEAAAALALQVEADHEIALLMDREIDRQREEARRAAEQARREHEARIAREAAERAEADAAARVAAELAEAGRRESEAKLAAERAQREQQEAERRALEAEARAEREKVEAAERAEQARAAAIEQERQRVEAAQREQAAEQARREADVQHKRAINTAAMRALVEHAGLTDEQAKAVIVAIARGQVGNVSIRY